MKRMFVFIGVFVMLGLSFILIPPAQTNYDMTKYLPDDSMTKQGLLILEDEFGVATTIQIMIEDVSVLEVLTLKTQLNGVSSVSSIIWLDEYIDLELIPIEFVDAEIKIPFYQDNKALMTVIFNRNAYDINLETSFDEINLILRNYSYAIRGEALVNIQARNIAQSEVIKIMIIIIPLILIILIIASHAWIEPLLIIITLGFAVMFNISTNGIFQDVSFITQTMALALQLALSIDYALIMLHRFGELRISNDPKTSAYLARKLSFKSITASALTTIAGFTALFFMRYQIGLDIGLVLSKGIILSYLSTMIILPILLIWFDNLIQKTRHRMFMPDFSKLFNFQYRIRYLLLILLLGGIGFGFYASIKTEFIYGTNTLSPNSQLQKEQDYITSIFGYYEPIVILFENETIQQEILLSSDLIAYDKIDPVDALVTEVDPNIPRDFLPIELRRNYVGASYGRMMIYTSVPQETPELFEMIGEIKSIVGAHYDTFYMVGSASAIHDIKTSIDQQSWYITLISIGMVGLIIGIMFKSFWIPILLIGVIQGAIWINLSTLFIQNNQVLYIGYLVVMSIQLGATIDYALLLTNRYKDERICNEPYKAMKFAYEKSALTMLISGSILMVAGFAEGIFSDIESVTMIGLLLGKGALISFLLTFMFLPVLLIVSDRWTIRVKKKS